MVSVTDPLDYAPSVVHRVAVLALCLALLVACDPEGAGDAGAPTATDASAGDAGSTADAGVDAGSTDGGASDGGAGDAGPDTDAGTDPDAGAGLDAGADAGVDAGLDAGTDAGFDAGFDAGSADAGAPPVTCTEPGLMTRVISDSASVGTPDTYFFDVNPGDPFCAEITGGGSGTWGVTVSNGTSGGVYCSNVTPCRIRVPAGEMTLLVTAQTSDIGFYTLTVHSIPR